MKDQGQDNLLSCLRAVWWRGQALHAMAGALAFCRWVVPLFLAGVLVDWLVDLPWPARILVLLAVVGVPAFKAWRGGWRNAGSFDATRTALQIEQTVGGLESLLVTAVQFRHVGPKDGVSESLRDVTRQRAEEAASQLRSRDIVRFQPLGRPAIPAAIAALVVVVIAVLSGPLLLAGATRIFAPWASVSYPTRTHVELADGDIVVKEGDRARIEAVVSGVIPKKAKLVLRTGTGTSRQHELPITDGKCDYTMESVFRGFEYQIVAGDARSPWHTVRVIPPPRIERAEVRLDFPEYTKRPVQTGEALTVVVPENTGIEWRLTLDRAVSKADFVTGDNDAQPLEVSQDGRTVTLRRVATESRAYSFSWVEREHGFAFTSPRNYVQVAPDQRPTVELTSPRADIYATLGRKLDLAFRGRDDYGIGESVVSYRVNKTGEATVAFPVPAVHDGSEQRIDWDYRTALPDLAVGDSVTLAVEIADRYPGPNGPQRARSDARRITFLSTEQYLEQITKQKQRLLSQLQTIYREERAVHDLVRRLDPMDAAFVQTCQLEAVRQDLMRERIVALAREMRALIDDLAANNITDASISDVLVRLSAKIDAIAAEHVGGAAASLRALASASGQGTAGSVTDPSAAVLKVNTAARELGLLVLELGYKDAAEVIARELHATAQTQASLRMKTLLPGKAASDATDAVAESQEQLAQSLTRLLAATPREQESTPSDALVAFGLTRLSKQLVSAGVQTKMHEAVALIRGGKPADAARLQAEAIQSLLGAEFRLRFGSEYESLSKAREAFSSQAEGLKALREEIVTLPAEEFKARQSGVARAQAALQRNLHLLLMPAVPAPRPRLFDLSPPPAPPVHDQLAAAEDSMKNAMAYIDAADREAVVREQAKAEQAIGALANIVRQRLEAMTQLERMASLFDSSAIGGAKLSQFRERQLGLLEKTTDAAGDRADAAHLADPQQKLIEELGMLRTEIKATRTDLGARPEDLLPVQSRLDAAARAMTDAEASLRANQPAQASSQQKAAIAALKDAEGLLADDATRVASFVKVIGDAQNALAPAPYVGEIEAEQRDLIGATRKAQPAELPGLIMPQKNLVHAVNAVLSALEVLAHKVDSGTDMLFAKTDMDSAAAALEGNDVEEAVEVQTAVADSVKDLYVRLQAATPQYGYILEITEFAHDVLPQAVSLRAAQSELRAKVATAADDAAVRQFVSEQRELESKAKALGELLQKATGQDRYNAAAKQMVESAERLGAGNKTAAVPLMEQAESTLASDAAELLLLLKNLAVVLDPPMPAQEPAPEVKLLLDVLPAAAQQKALRVRIQTQVMPPEQLAGLVATQRVFEKQFEEFAQRSQSHPKLVEAKQYMTAAATKMETGARPESVASQQQAGEVLRHFVIEYIAKYIQPPGAAGPQPPAATDEPGDESDISLFMPGAVSGKMPKNGRAEWEVLGRRERAALNENFARELPLEYRAILKDYYERLTR